MFNKDISNKNLRLLIFQYLLLETNRDKSVNIDELTRYLNEKCHTNYDGRTVGGHLKALYNIKDELKEVFHVNVVRTGNGNKGNYHIEKALGVNSAANIINALEYDLFISDKEANAYKSFIMNFCDNSLLDNLKKVINKNKKLKSKFSYFYEKYLAVFKSLNRTKGIACVSYFESYAPNNKLIIEKCHVVDIIKLFGEPYIKLIDRDDYKTYQISLFNILGVEELDYNEFKMLRGYNEESLEYKAILQKSFEKYPDYSDTKKISFCLDYNIDSKSLFIRYKEIFNELIFEEKGQMKYVVIKKEKNIIKDYVLFDKKVDANNYIKNTKEDNINLFGPIEKICYTTSCNEDRFVKWVLNPDVFSFVRILGPKTTVDKINLAVVNMYNKITNNDL